MVRILKQKKKSNKILDVIGKNLCDCAVELYKSYQFVLTSENQIQFGYITEKPFNALLAGAIPIYVGTSEIKQILNPKCFIYVEQGKTLESCMQVILNKKIIFDMQTSIPLSPEKLFLFSWHSDVESYLKKRTDTTTLKDIIYNQMNSIEKRLLL